jgi:predicted SAM-dependent methyltransferase
MKLNIGCGKQYKTGFINIDAFDSTIADKIMPAHNLAFPSNSIDEIEAIQLIEHLGFITARYALAEWFRVLKPGGTLLIETPDIETSFREYLEGNHKTKKELLSWVFGVDSPGMSHQLCFPVVLLEDLLRKTGFTTLKKSFLKQKTNNPTFQICCKKPQKYEVFQIISCCRKTMMNKKLVVTEPDSVALEQEAFLDFLLTQLRRYQKNKERQVIDELVTEGGIRSPMITRILIKECIRQRFLRKQLVQRHLHVLDFLISINTPALLLYVLKESPGFAGTQAQTLEMVHTLGKHSVRQLLSGGKTGSTVKISLEKLSRQYNPRNQIFFSDTCIEYEAAQLAYQGVKDFIQGDYKNAIMRLQEAVRLDRNHLLYYWNLGRLFVLTKKFSQAQKWYDDALILVKSSQNPIKKKLEKILIKERNTLLQKNWYGPVIEVNI